jgi:hypothetical protein
MPIVFIGLDPEQFLASMENLRLIADPRWSREQYVTLEYVEQGK